MKTYERPPRQYGCPDCGARPNRACGTQLTETIWMNLPIWHPGREALAGVKEETA
jgi:hypothetical protein